MDARLIDIAKNYYTAVGQKDLETVKRLIDPNVQLIGPMAQASNKQEFLDGLKGFMGALTKLEIRHTFESNGKVALIYDVNFPDPIGTIRGCSLMDFNGDFITRIELFFDASPFKIPSEAIS